MPLSGGEIPIGLVAGSSWNENPAGYESVSHKLSAVMPYGPGASVTRLSNSTIALLLASSPVTTRRISEAVPVEEDSRMITIVQNILRMVGTPSAVRSCVPRSGKPLFSVPPNSKYLELRNTVNTASGAV